MDVGKLMQQCQEELFERTKKGMQCRAWILNEYYHLARAIDDGNPLQYCTKAAFNAP